MDDKGSRKMGSRAHRKGSANIWFLKVMNVAAELLFT